MNAFQIHLALNHLPLFAVLAAFVTQLYAFVAKQNAVLPLARIFLWVGVVTGVTAFLSGDAAEDAGKALAVALPKEWVHEHEELGEAALILGIIYGVTDLGLHFVKGILAKKGKVLPKPLLGIQWLLVAAWLLVLFFAAHQGGMIKHEEIRPIQSQSS